MSVRGHVCGFLMLLRRATSTGVLSHCAGAACVCRAWVAGVCQTRAAQQSHARSVPDGGSTCMPLCPGAAVLFAVGVPSTRSGGPHPLQTAFCCRGEGGAPWGHAMPCTLMPRLFGARCSLALRPRCFQPHTVCISAATCPLAQAALKHHSPHPPCSPKHHSPHPLLTQAPPPPDPAHSSSSPRLPAHPSSAPPTCSPK